MFRDEASLSANPQLWMSIQHAVEASRFFILLASPAAARSEWVRREAAHRARMSGTADFLIVLTEGDIAWDAEADDFDWVTTTALPSDLAGMFTRSPSSSTFGGHHRWTS